jgi:hypothetical protein
VQPATPSGANPGNLRKRKLAIFAAITGSALCLNIGRGVSLNRSPQSTEELRTAVAVNAFRRFRTGLGSVLHHLMSWVQSISQVSPASSSSKQSDKNDFPLLRRLVDPRDARGQAGALVALKGGRGAPHPARPISLPLLVWIVVLGIVALLFFVLVRYFLSKTKKNRLRQKIM